MAGARMHFIEIVVLRGPPAMPTYALGFSTLALQPYILPTQFTGVRVSYCG
jgi:hypothetical protein